jgi:hypothetical protein
MSPLPPLPAPSSIQIDNVLPNTISASDGGGRVRVAGQYSAVIEGDADGNFSVIGLETLALMHDPDPELPPGSGPSWQTVNSVDGAGPIEVGALEFLNIRVQFGCPASPANETYTATAIVVLEGSQQQVLHVPITASVRPEQLTISVTQGPSTFNPGQTQDFVFLLESSFLVDIEGAFGQDYLNTPFTEVTPTSNFPAIPALGSVSVTVSVWCAPTTAGGNYVLTFGYSPIMGPALAQKLTADVQVIAPLPPQPDPRKDHQDAVWVAGSTKRICQLTGGGDPQGLPHPNDTTRFSLLGTDLGTSFDQFINGEHRTYFFFGDTTTNDGDSTGDAIAYTTDDQPEPEGLHLGFIMGDEQWRRLIIPRVSLEAFEVPSGGFSYGGRIYVFATTNYMKVGNSDYMESSVLASATDAHNNFDLAYYVSHRDDTTETPAMGGKFINVSPFVINNHDWPGLPNNAQPGGQGLLMAGSGAYRQSAPYLAYAPLADEQGPAQSEWRYLQEFGSWERGYGPSGPPIWSDLESDAMAMFDAQIGEISYSFHAGLGRWLLVYGGFAGGIGGIVLRSAPMPWGPWSEPQLIFNSERENAQGAYMFECGPYGAYVISRYNLWDPASQLATFYYTLSNGCCIKGCSEPRYQVHQMKSTLQLVNVG